MKPGLEEGDSEVIILGVPTSPQTVSCTHLKNSMELKWSFLCLHLEDSF